MLRPRVVTLDVNVERFGVPQMSGEENVESFDLLMEFLKKDQEKKLLEMAKNSLEAYIINTRSALSEESVLEVHPVFYCLSLIHI